MTVCTALDWRRPRTWGGLQTDRRQKKDLWLSLVQEAAADHLIVRTSWMFGPAGENFVSTMLNLGANQNSLNIVNDQHGSPTYTRHLAKAILTLFEKGARSIHHLTNSGSCTWLEFAKEIFRLGEVDVKVLPCSTEDYPTPARRPKNSVLDCTGVQNPNVSSKHPCRLGRRP